MIASGGFADGRGLVAALALGADGINMGSRFMCTAESAIHQKVKEAIVAGTELDTEMIFRPLRNTARVASNAVSREVVEILNNGGQFEDVKDLVAGSRGVKVYEIGDLDAGIWSVGTAMGLINDIPTCDELVSRIVDDAEELITEKLAEMVGESARRKRRLSNDQSFGAKERSTRGPHGANRLTGQRARCERVASDCVGQLLNIVELLGGVALDENIAVVERLEVNLDDISTGVVDPHVLNSMRHY